MAWEDITIEHLRTVARHYNSEVKIMGISKMKKADLITELKKHLNLNADGKGVTHKGGKEGFEWEIDEKKAKAPKKGEYRKEVKKADLPVPPPPKKAEDKSYKKKVVAKKVVQARGAVADAKAIKPPEPIEDKRSATEKFMKDVVPYDINEMIKGYIPKKQLEGGSASLPRAFFEGAKTDRGSISTTDMIMYILGNMEKDGIWKEKFEHKDKEIALKTSSYGTRFGVPKEMNSGLDMFEKLFKVPIRLYVSYAKAGMGNKAGTIYSIGLKKDYNSRTKEGKEEKADDIKRLKEEASALYKKGIDLINKGIMGDVLSRRQVERTKRMEKK
jgi:hypothetical protein